MKPACRMGCWTYGLESLQLFAGSRPAEQMNKSDDLYTCAFLTLVMSPRICGIQLSENGIPHLKESCGSGPFFNWLTNTSQHPCRTRSRYASAPLTLMGVFGGTRFSNTDGAALAIPRSSRREVAYESFMMMRMKVRI